MIYSRTQGLSLTTKMKKFTIIVILIVVFLLGFAFNTKTASATIGDACCPAAVVGIRWLYNLANNRCESTAGTSQAISCNASTERCNPGPPDMRGTCISRTGPTPTGTLCGYLGRPCCEGRSVIEKRTCHSPYVPSAEFSTTCICKEVSTLNTTCSLNGRMGVNTALGCIPTDDLNAFLTNILGKVIFVASGIAFLLMAFGAFQIITSAGSPEKVKAGSELITSALSGLLFILFSVFLLKLIGVDILHLPGFGT